ncbi:hypothetical protein RR48_12412 [Papilio machaon]|uniref:Uncharacterized protein n=1 Tax=Papilio machaon TaxID=76193 RepID=A0A194RS56_PAPMA|nr:hypothetical protein RR48_12412 [Papilio machaon]
MSVESSKPIRSDAGEPEPQDTTIRSPSIRVTAPKKSLALRLWVLLQPLARLWGLITAVVLSGAGAELMVLGYEVAPGFLVGAALVFLLETMWVAALFVDLLCRRGQYTLSLRCWDFARWSCGRARAPFYACAATSILFANLTILAAVAAVTYIFFDPPNDDHDRRNARRRGKRGKRWVPGVVRARPSRDESVVLRGYGLQIYNAAHSADDSETGSCEMQRLLSPQHRQQEHLTYARRHALPLTLHYRISHAPCLQIDIRKYYAPATCFTNEPTRPVRRPWTCVHDHTEERREVELIPCFV